MRGDELSIVGDKVMGMVVRTGRWIDYLIDLRGDQMMKFHVRRVRRSRF